MHESYQFENSGKPDSLQLPWTAYHTQVNVVTFAILHSSCPKKPLELSKASLCLKTLAVVSDKHLEVHISIVSVVHYRH